LPLPREPTMDVVGGGGKAAGAALKRPDFARVYAQIPSTQEAANGQLGLS
jgi:hypothetical protein